MISLGIKNMSKNPKLLYKNNKNHHLQKNVEFWVLNSEYLNFPTRKNLIFFKHYSSVRLTRAASILGIFSVV